MTAIYQGSKGPVAIASMPYPHLRNALEKLQREGAPDRQAEIAAMSARLAHLDAEQPESAAPDDNPRAVIGGNDPPVETPRVVTARPLDGRIWPVQHRWPRWPRNRESDVVAAPALSAGRDGRSLRRAHG